MNENEMRIDTIIDDQIITLTKDYVLGPSDSATVHLYPSIDGWRRCLIVGDGVKTCEELIKERAQEDLLILQRDLNDIQKKINKLQEVLLDEYSYLQYDNEEWQ